MSRCGSVSLDGFAGQWRADAEGWANASVADGRLRWGSEPRSELCAVHAVERAPDTLLVIALWHHDLDDPGDASLTYVSLQRRGDTLRVCRDDDRDRLDGGLEDDGRCVELSRATP